MLWFCFAFVIWCACLLALRCFACCGLVVLLIGLLLLVRALCCLHFAVALVWILLVISTLILVLLCRFDYVVIVVGFAFWLCVLWGLFLFDSWVFLCCDLRVLCFWFALFRGLCCDCC